MNIKQAEMLSGVSRQNIRFYEREGLLTPERNPENDYREYNEAHIHTLKLIRALRMLDMPLEQIKSILRGNLNLSEAATVQRDHLKDQVQQLTAAIRFCEELTASEDISNLNVDDILSRMENPDTQKSLYQKWVEDYKKVVLSEREKIFTFIPEEAVTNPQEFSMALFRYAKENHLDLTITRESMYPEFTINGIEYAAERFYTTVQRVPVATIRCQVKYPEDFETDIPPARKKLMKLLNLSWLPVLFILMNLDWILHTDWAELLSTWQGWLVLLSLLSLIFAGLYRTWLFHFNEKVK